MICGGDDRQGVDLAADFAVHINQGGALMKALHQLISETRYPLLLLRQSLLYMGEANTAGVGRLGAVVGLPQQVGDIGRVQ